MKSCKDCKWHLVERKATPRFLGKEAEYDYCYHPSITDDSPISPVTGKKFIPTHTDRLCNLIRMDSNHKCGPDGNLWELP